ncbi:hypothetical protein [Streptomyces phaeochromogenes]|uniref:hypothetical protein n=1 Tax=Streptomyces phaeochromogenes TaxID=1923 RepID=UPI003714C658
MTALDGKAETYGYNASGFLDKVTNARGKAVTSNIYDAQGRVASQTDAIGHTTKFAYSKNGEFDQVDVTAPDQGVWTDVYYKNVLFTQLDPLNNKSYYRYDKFFNRTSEVDAEIRETQWDFDTSGRIKSQTTNSKAIGYVYDKAGNLTTTTLPTTTARGETRTYDEVGRLASMTTPTSSNTYTYDENNRLTQDKPGTGNATRYAYDDAGRITRSCTDTSATSCLTGTTGDTQTYDKVGNLKTSVTGGTTTTYGYNAGDQLLSSTARSTTTSYTYDADGNQTKDDDGTYAYDPAGRVKSATIGSDSFSFLYDADGNRTVANKNNALIRTSRWDITGDLPQIATDTDASGALIADYHFDPDGTARSMDRTAGTYYFTQDHQNSVSTVFDAAGVDNYRYTYGPWGISTGTATISGGQSSVYGYTGQYKRPVSARPPPTAGPLLRHHPAALHHAGSGLAHRGQSQPVVLQLRGQRPRQPRRPLRQLPDMHRSRHRSRRQRRHLRLPAPGRLRLGRLRRRHRQGRRHRRGRRLPRPGGHGPGGLPRPLRRPSPGRRSRHRRRHRHGLHVGDQHRPVPADYAWGPPLRRTWRRTRPLIGPAWRWGKGLFGKASPTPTRFGPGAARAGDPALLPKGEKANPLLASSGCGSRSLRPGGGALRDAARRRMDRHGKCKALIHARISVLEQPNSLGSL